jgi:hypothetical protein
VFLPPRQDLSTELEGSLRVANAALERNAQEAKEMLEHMRNEAERKLQREQERNAAVEERAKLGEQLVAAAQERARLAEHQLQQRSALSAELADERLRAAGQKATIAETLAQVSFCPVAPITQSTPGRGSTKVARPQFLVLPFASVSGLEKPQAIRVGTPLLPRPKSGWVVGVPLQTRAG